LKKPNNYFPKLFIVKKILFSLIFFSCFFAKAQQFEGVITYKINCTNCTTAKDSNAVASMMGTQQLYYFKNDNYRSDMDGFLSSQMYTVTNNTIYSTTKAGKQFSQDAAICTDSVKSHLVTKNSKKIAGLLCHKLEVKGTQGTIVYYFHNSLAINATSFAKHCYGNWNIFTAITKSLPLAYTISIGKLNIEVVCTNMERKALEDSIFTIEK
jgi:hypothetical protein